MNSSSSPKTDFQISGIAADAYAHLFDWDEKALSKIGAQKMQVDQHPGYPCRVSLEDATLGEEVILFPFEHHAVVSPYRASGPIFIRKNAAISKLGINAIPPILQHRLLSLRAYDAQGMMIQTAVIPGKNLVQSIPDMLSNSQIEYIQVHNAGPGCYNCQINRVALT